MQPHMHPWWRNNLDFERFRLNNSQTRPVSNTGQWLVIQIDRTVRRVDVYRVWSLRCRAWLATMWKVHKMKAIVGIKWPNSLTHRLFIQRDECHYKPYLCIFKSLMVWLIGLDLGFARESINVSLPNMVRICCSASVTVSSPRLVRSTKVGIGIAKL